ncbi:MAG: DUF512 domain-containing protein [Dehalococcoidia bacterium]
MQGWQRQLRAEHSASVVQAADEYYLIAGARITAAWYDGFNQYENGIGMTRTLLDDWRAARAVCVGPPAIARPPPSVATMTVGCSARSAPT